MLLAAALFILFHSQSQQQSAPTNDMGVPTQHAESSLLSVVGTIEAHDVVGVSAPFDGIIQEKHLTFDSRVEKGQLLLILDTEELSDRIQGAKITLLKATNSMEELADWKSSGEVARSRRNLLQAQQQVEQSERRVREAETLLQKGIISRSEYEGMLEQLDGLKNQMEAVSDDLRATNAKANKRNLQIARIEFEQAKAKLTELTSGLSRARIFSPDTGIVTKSPASSGQSPATLDAGSRISKGQLLFNVSLTDKLRVTAKVDEVDVADLALGMPVVVSVDLQGMPPLHGRLAEISAQANISGNGSRSAVFDIKIDLPDIDAQQRSRLRIGMTCNVSIDTSKQAPFTPPQNN